MIDTFSINGKTYSLSYVLQVLEDADSAARAEREACAKIAEDHFRTLGTLTSFPAKSEAAWRIRNAIRARGDK